MDRREAEQVVGCFAPDAHLEVIGEQLVVQGHDEIRAVVIGSFDREMLGGPAGRSTHANTNTLIEFSADGGATAETWAVVFLANGSGAVAIRGVHYSDRCRQVEGRWRLAARRHQLEWQALAPGDPTG